MHESPAAAALTGNSVKPQSVYTGVFPWSAYPRNYGIFGQKTILTYYYLNATWQQIFGGENVNRAGYSSVPRVRTSMQEPLKRDARCSPLVARAFSTQASHLCRGRSSEAPFLSLFPTSQILSRIHSFTWRNVWGTIEGTRKMLQVHAIQKPKKVLQLLESWQLQRILATYSFRPFSLWVSPYNLVAR